MFAVFCKNCNNRIIIWFYPFLALTESFQVALSTLHNMTPIPLHTHRRCFILRGKLQNPGIHAAQLHMQPGNANLDSDDSLLHTMNAQSLQLSLAARYVSVPRLRAASRLTQHLARRRTCQG